METLILWLTTFSDGTILLVSATLTVGLALAIAFAMHRFWLANRLDALEEHTKLAEVVHGSLLAFAVFVLALVLSDVRTNLARADDAVSREGSFVARLDRDLASLPGPEAAQARASLRAYVEAVVAGEWTSLSERSPTLAGSADQALAKLVPDMRKVISTHPEAGPSLRSLIEKLEDYRQGRLEAATKSVPHIFWLVIGVFLIAAMAMNGRYKLNWIALSLISVHMAAIGLVLGLIITMDEPFRGETSISPLPLLSAINTAK